MKILLVDDEPDILLLYRQMLEGNGYEVVEARNGKEVMKKISDEAFDLVVMDLYMPKMDGFETVREMRKDGQRVPVIVMTGHYTDDVVEERIRGLGVEAILRKPVMITTLMNENCLRKRLGSVEAVADTTHCHDSFAHFL
jgi:two-component system nitrogen regulation response regulator NtrX